MKLRLLIAVATQLSILILISAVKTENADNGSSNFSNQPTYQHFSNETTQLINLGTIEGKSYFADSVLRTWQATLKYCGDLGMRLAKITSKPQYDFLRATANPGTFKGWFWTAGRDKQNINQFSWNDDGTNINPYTSVINGMGNRTYMTCLCYSADNGAYYLRECDHAHYALCET